jgi:hypothetical protein
MRSEIEQTTIFLWLKIDNIAFGNVRHIYFLFHRMQDMNHL